MKQSIEQKQGSSSRCTETHLPKLKFNKSTAFVLGNGTSRKSVDPVSLSAFGKTYGCNAQYREYSPDYLIAVDREMVKEIVDSGYDVDHEVWTNPTAVGRSTISRTHLNIFDPYKGWSSGPTALWLASTHRYNEIFILGFDYKGINGKLNNIYADTKNYKRSKDNATYYGNWLKQTVKVIQEFKHIKYYRVIEEGNFIPNEFIKLPNITHITYPEFHLICSK